MLKRNAKAVSSKRLPFPQRLQQRLHPGYLSEREEKKTPQRELGLFFLISLTLKQKKLTNLQLKKKVLECHKRHRTKKTKTKKNPF